MSTSTIARNTGRATSLANDFANANGHAPMLICDPSEIVRVTAHRAELGLDRYDEVWDGVTIAMSLPNNPHQEIVAALCAIIRMIFGIPGPHHVFPGANVSDRHNDWMLSHRCPDVLVYLDGNPAINYGTHWCGGPDFLVEIISEGDPSREKLPFYESINTREVLIVDRDPWQLELYKLRGSRLELAGTSTIQQPDMLISSALPFSFRLAVGADRPRIEVTHQETKQAWLI